MPALTCRYQENKTCDRQWISSQTGRRFCILLRETFSKSIAFTLINKYIKLLWFKFQECLGPFTMLHFDGSSETGLFRHVSNHGFLSPLFRKYISYEGHVSWKCSEFNRNFKNGGKNREKCFPFRDKCIWIGSAKLSLLRKEYLWPPVNVLKNSFKILSITKRDFFEFNCFRIDH